MDTARSAGGQGTVASPAMGTSGTLGTRNVRLPAPVTLALEVAGAGLLLATGGMHLDLYLTGYRQIPTIGDLFLLQVIATFVAAVAVLVLRRRLVDAAAALLSIGTLAGCVAFRIWTIFNFHEVGTTAGTTAGIIEIAAFLVLATSALVGSTRTAKNGETSGGSGSRTSILWPAAIAVLAVAGAASLLAANGSSRSGSSVPGASGGATITIQNFVFSPVTLTVKPGATVTVVNKDGVAHTVTSTTGAFNTGVVAAGTTATFRAPSTPGTYHFHCAIHVTMPTDTLIVS